MELKLLVGWKCRLKLYAEGNKLCAEGKKLWAEGNKLCAEGNKIWAEGNKLCAEGKKLWAEGDKLCAEGNKIWAEIIIETFGNIKLEWKNWNDKYRSYECHLENGEVYGFDLENSADKEVKDAINLLEKKGKIKDGKIVVN